MKRAGGALLLFLCAGAVLAPWLAPNPPNQRFTDLLYAPPTPIYLFDQIPDPRSPIPETKDQRPETRNQRPKTKDVFPTAPFIYPWRLVSRLERRFAASPQPVRLRWFTDGRLVTADPAAGAPLLVLGTDGYGRDVLARLLHGSRTTLALAAVASAAATILGLLLGGVAGYARGWVDVVLSRAMELALVIPAIYAALAIRSFMPLVLSSAAVFVTLAAIFAILGAPIVARGVRAVVMSEREQEYATAARAAGATSLRVLAAHLLPAARPYALVQATLLFPAFILGEATLSYVGLGFPAATPTWGTMLQDAANISLLADMPWALAPAGAIFLAVLGANLTVQGTGRAPVQLEGSSRSV